MMAALAPRGPDGEGSYRDAGVALGHRRLAVIDVDGGAQPLYAANGRVVGVVNGEIYNYRELRRQLRARDHAFATGSDSEVVVHGYAEWGEAVLDRIEGQFALAVWDRRDRTLLLARDRMGEKPLFWAELPGGGLAFASELRALLRHPAIDDRVDPRALARYLALEYVPAPMSIVRGARKLEPGSRLRWRAGRTDTGAYWDLPLPSRDDARDGVRLWDLDRGADALAAELRRSVRERLVADVPLGVFLSGGLDSSVVAALASAERGGDLDTFSIGFADTSYDESPHARHVAEYIGSRHHEWMVEPGDVLEQAGRLGALLDEPLGDASLVPTHLLARFARQNVTVAVGGDGGDELFSGYPTFLAEAIAGRTLDRLPRSVAEALTVGGTLLGDALPTSSDHFSTDFKVRQFLRGVGERGPRRHQAWLGSFLPGEVRDVLVPPVAALIGDDLYDVIDQRLERCPSDDRWDRLLYFYAKGYLADDVLTKVDRASMQVALEVRAPLLDRAVVDLACRAAPRLRFSRRKGKRLLKRAARGLIPDEIIDRPKHGFAMPVSAWLRGELHELLRDTLAPDRLRADGLFDPDAVTALIDAHRTGRADHRKQLWTLLAFQSWMDSRSPRSR